MRIQTTTQLDNLRATSTERKEGLQAEIKVCSGAGCAAAIAVQKESDRVSLSVAVTGRQEHEVLALETIVLERVSRHRRHGLLLVSGTGSAKSHQQYYQHHGCFGAAARDHATLPRRWRLR